MPIASGVAKSVAIKKETTWGAEGASGGAGFTTRTGAKYLRRKSSTVDLRKETYQSEEIRTDYQVADMRHGVRSVGGAIEGELAPGSYPEFMAALMRKDFAAGGVTTAQITISSSTGSPQFSRSGGSFVTDGFRAGMVIRFTGWATTAAAYNGVNFLITDLTATTLTGVFLSPVTLVTKAAGDSVSISCPGKVTYTPTAGHTDDSFMIEHWYSDIAQSELFVGNKLNSAKVSLPPSGIASVSFDVMGKDLLDTSARRNSIALNTQYFTTPTAAGSTGVLAAVSGAVYVGGAAVALLTGMSFDVSGNMSADPVVGSNVYPDIVEGRVMVSGEMTVYFQDAAFRDYFSQESEVKVIAVFATGSGATADFISFTMPRVKVGGSSKSDGEKGLVQTVPFTAIAALSTDVAAFPTTLMIQDSLAP